MVIKNVELETVCGITSTIPDHVYPEIAFAGKSNVGKSSLINALMNRRSLARTSSKPGKTQTINFYNINDAMYLVDLPGYGYATANEEIKAKWGVMIENYLHKSKKLVAVFLLIDIRHDPSENDQLMYHWMVSQGFAPIIIATKLDKIVRSKVERHLQAIADGLQVEPNTIIIPFSAETKQGREDIWELMDALIGVNLPKDDESLAEESAGEPQNPAAIAGGAEETEKKARKPRWKNTDRPVAKKTLQKRKEKAATGKKKKKK